MAPDKLKLDDLAVSQALVSRRDRIRTDRSAPAALPTLDPTLIDRMPRSFQPVNATAITISDS